MHRKPPRRERYMPAATIIAALLAVVLAALFGSASSSSAASTSVGGHAAQLLTASAPITSQATSQDSDYCDLSAHWRVNGSATWYGNGLSYTVLSSPGTLINGGDPASYSIASGTATTNRYASYYMTSAAGATPKVYRSDHYGYNTSRVTIQVYGGNSACWMVLDR